MEMTPLQKILNAGWQICLLVEERGDRVHRAWKEFEEVAASAISEARGEGVLATKDWPAPPTTGHGHFMRKCQKCDVIVEQCRCMGPKQVELVLCQKCR